MLRATVEKFSTGEIDLIDLHEEVPNVRVFDIFKYLQDQSIWTRGLNFTELLFFIHFAKEGWSIGRLPYNRSDPVSKLRDSDLRLSGINPEWCYGKGTPDFMLVKQREDGKIVEIRFVEIKHAENKLNKHQVEWYNKWKKEIYVYKLTPHFNIAEKGPFYAEIAEESILKINRLKR